VSSDGVQSSLDQRYKPVTLALAGVAVALAGIMPAVFYLLPNDYQIWNMSIIGAIALFAASRLGFWWGVGLVGLAIGFKDTSFYLTRGWHPSIVSWPCFMLYALVGWTLIKQSRSPIRIGASALSGSILFFLVNNFCCWLEPGLGYEPTFNGLMTCYRNAVPFFRGTIMGDLVFSGALFAAHAALSYAYSPKGEAITIPTDE
jgi:hypothetical protein